MIKLPKLKDSKSAAKYHEWGKLRRGMRGGMTLEEMEEYIKTDRLPSWVPEVGFRKRPCNLKK